MFPVPVRGEVLALLYFDNVMISYNTSLILGDRGRGDSKRETLGLVVGVLS